MLIFSLTFHNLFLQTHNPLVLEASRSVCLSRLRTAGKQSPPARQVEQVRTAKFTKSISARLSITTNETHKGAHHDPKAVPGQLNTFEQQCDAALVRAWSRLRLPSPVCRIPNLCQGGCLALRSIPGP